MVYYPANRRYQAKNVLKVTVGFNRNTEADLVEMLEAQKSRAGFLKELAKRELPEWQKAHRAKSEEERRAAEFEEQVRAVLGKMGTDPE